MSLSRREFLTATSAAVASPLLAIEPIARPGTKPLLKLALAAYSFNRFLSLKGKNPPTMKLDEFLDFAATQPVDGVELTSYYFTDTSDDALAKLKSKCTRLGLDITGTPVGNNFCVRDPEKLQEQIKLVKTWTERCAKLGGKAIRIFAGNLEKGDDLAAAQKRVIAATEECCEYAGKFGVYLALENHGGITAKVDDLLTLVKGVKSDFFGVNLDTGNFHTEDPYADLVKLAPYAVNVQVKTEMSPAGGKKSDADLKRLVQILRDANYRGYVILEYEAAEDPKLAVPKAIKELKELLHP